MKTIVHYLSSDIKVNQDFKYRQITQLKGYRSIVIGEFAKRDSEEEYPFEYYYMNDITNWPRFIKEHRVKAIHAHLGGDGVKILPVALRHNLPLIVSFRGNDSSAQSEKRKINRDKYRDLKKHGSLFLPVCNFFKKELIKLGFRKDQIQVLYGGIDTDKFTFQKYKPNNGRSFRILSIGRLVQKKGFPDLIKSFRSVHKKYPKAKLVIVGKGEEKQREKLVKLINKYNLKSAVELKKEMKNGRVVKEFHKSDLFCLPSYTTAKGSIEGIPNVLKEAMSCGTPVVSTFHAGIPELIEHKKSGVLVKERDHKALTDAMIKLLKDPDKCRKYAKKARKKVKKHFNLRKQIEVQERYYNELLGNKE